MMRITTWIINFAPLGVCFLVAGQLLEMKDVQKELRKLGWYVLVVILGLALHGLLVLPLIYTVICRKLPFRSTKKVFPLHTSKKLIFHRQFQIKTIFLKIIAGSLQTRARRS